MKKNKLHITVGIPAFNEEANIGDLLDDIFSQKNNKFILDKIIIVSDNSTDNTNTIVRTKNTKKILLIINSRRLGAALSQNKIIKRSQSKVLILLNGDIRIYDSNFINKLITPFFTNNNIGLVCPMATPTPSKTYFETIINYSVDLKYHLYNSLPNKDNIYLCRGSARAMLHETYKSFTWKATISEDAFSYLSVKRLGYKFKYLENCSIYYRSPANYKDHFKQSNRFIQGTKNLKLYFTDDLMDKEFKIPLRNQIISGMIYFIKNPVLFISYIFIFCIVIILQNKKNDFPTWDIASSSKLLR